MAVNYLKPTVRGYINGDVNYRYIRIDKAAEMYGYTKEQIQAIASAAGAVYKLPKITLINRQRLEDYMRHMVNVPGTNKMVNKVFVRPGEGMILYSIGRERFINMAREAGAVYKLTDGIVLVHLETFDEYMERFRQKPREAEQDKGEEVG